MVRNPSLDKRKAILDAALTLFAQRGFYGTAVPLIGEEAGVGAGTIYRYFASKEALANALFCLWKQALEAALFEGFPFHAPVRDQFHHLWAAAIHFARNNPHAFVFLELHHHQPYLDAESLAVDREVLGRFLRLIENAQVHKAVKPLPPTLLLSLIWGMIVSFVKGCWKQDISLTDESFLPAEICAWEAIRL